VDENEILGKADDPDRVYVEEIMPAKIKLNMRYIENRNLNEYFKIIGLTFINILR
jgi:lipopolysaccharide/colanic/teichoic acid biosynthesis glycosyltransferase